MAETIFTKIINKEIPADIIYEDENYLVFHDIHPQAPVHVLVIPKEPLACINEMNEAHVELIGGLFLTAKTVANQLGLDSYRLMINSGEDAGQTVFHLHLHLMGGKKFDENSMA